MTPEIRSHAVAGQYCGDDDTIVICCPGCGHVWHAQRITLRSVPGDPTETVYLGCTRCGASLDVVGPWYRGQEAA